MQIEQYTITLTSQPKTCQLITSEIINHCTAIKTIDKGFVQLFLQHTSASLTINENADVEVRRDLTMSLDRIVPETFPYHHDEEGPDDMPAHVKSSMLGVSLQIPLAQGRLLLGTWQGIYLCEHRSQSQKRRIICSVWGR